MNYTSSASFLQPKAFPNCLKFIMQLFLFTFLKFTNLFSEVIIC